MAFGPRLMASFSLTLMAVMPLVASAQQTPRPDPAAIEFFEKKVRPILVDNCYNCHSANTNAKGELRVDDRNGLLAGGSSGAAVVPGQPEKSLLITAVSYTDGTLKMPPKKQLSAEQIVDLTKWIKDGAAWPEVDVPVDLGKRSEKYEKLKKDHWAWQPLTTPSVPQVSDSGWARDDIDRFVLAKLDQQKLKPVGDADNVALIRRVTFDLTGLPPTVEEIDAFVLDSTPDAFSKVVDRLLGATAFGERWGRHWLDVARFGESTGSARNLPYPQAWRYRDYVVDAFNRDKPFDKFIREQVAGDLLPYESQDQRDEQLIATGFLALGVKDVNQRFKVRYIMDNVDEQIDAVTRSVLAMTASCARCHDHKFDPIPTTDYYALAGIFQSTDLCAGLRNKMGGGGLDYYDNSMLIQAGTPVAPDPEKVKKIEVATKAAAEAKAAFEAIRQKPEGSEPGPDGRPKRAIARQKMNRAQAELAALTDPAANGGKTILGVRDSKAVADTQIRIRGEAEKLGPVVPRGFLSIVEIPDQPKVNAAQSGRQELASWLTNEKNPLISRVLANRVWQHLFGEGIVRSVDNFGVTGDVPSHPELLDHLANRFVHEGWSVKKLVRAIVLSRAYQLSSDAIAANVAVDPANRYIWRHSPRRLDAEEIRDAMLAAAGRLNLSRPNASPAKDLRVVELPNNGPIARKIGEDARSSQHRSVYLPLLRGLVPTSLEVFDFAEQGMVTGNRDTTTVATQALYLLNDPFVRRQSLTLAEKLLSRAELDDTTRLDLAYRLTIGRSATTAEIERAKSYLADYETAYQTSIAEGLAAKTEVVPAQSVATVIPANGAAATSEVASPVPGTTPATTGQAATTPPVAVPQNATKPADPAAVGSTATTTTTPAAAT
ncbi:MAG: Protein of unknown function (DUF1553)/Protein of unknown function (DUF1549)/Planctomycete, partial [Planctomycetaceae bacterium]|nr:Protein of unknown function (DUF1553)/Protein of unknown function (DUF1549)/Planctomycete [Planctomycetaceae bacterium]